MERKRALRRGFTLIELLVVIAIIGILAAIVLTALNTSRSKGRDARRLTDLHTLSTAIQLYYGDNNFLPRNQLGWCTYISNPTNGWGAAFQSDLSPKYLSKVPLDPTLANHAGDYFYGNRNNTLGNFTLCAVLENPTGVHTSTWNWLYCSDWTAAYNYCIDY